MARKICRECRRSMDPEDFSDDISYRKFLESGICEECQNDVHNG